MHYYRLFRAAINPRTSHKSRFLRAAMNLEPPTRAGVIRINQRESEIDIIFFNAFMVKTSAELLSVWDMVYSTFI